MLQQLVAGDTLSLTINLARFPASEGWVLHYRLTDRLGTGTPIAIDASASGDGHVIDVDATTTSAWKAGDYAVAAWVSRGAQRYTVASECGQVRILPNPADLSAGIDTRSQAVRTLQVIRDKLAGKASDAIMRYRIGDREVQSYSLTELFKLERFWSAQVAIEDRAAGITNARGQVRRIRVAVR